MPSLFFYSLSIIRSFPISCVAPLYRTHAHMWGSNHVAGLMKHGWWLMRVAGWNLEALLSLQGQLYPRIIRTNMSSVFPILVCSVTSLSASGCTKLISQPEGSQVETIWVPAEHFFHWWRQELLAVNQNTMMLWRKVSVILLLHHKKNWQCSFKNTVL
jgi:hypothetical protein